MLIVCFEKSIVAPICDIADLDSKSGHGPSTTET